MIKKNIKKNLLGITTGVAAASVVLSSTLLLELNKENLNLKGNRNYVDSTWKDIKIANLGFSPIKWTNNTVLPVNYEGNDIKNIYDTYNYGQTNTLRSSTTIKNSGTKLGIELYSNNPLYDAKLNRSGADAAPLINIQASKININALNSTSITYEDFVSQVATTRTNARWAINSSTANETTATDRLVRVLIRKPFGENDTFAQKAYGTNPAQGLTYLTDNGSGTIGTMPQYYSQTGNGTSINPNTQPLINIETGTNDPASANKFMVLDLIAYMDINNQWNFLPNFQNSSTLASPTITNNSIDESVFNKGLTAKEALEKVITDQTKFLNFTATNAPKFWDETSTISAQYDDLSGKIRIIFSVKQDIDTTKKYDNTIFDNKQLNPITFKNISRLNNDNGHSLIKDGRQNFVYEIAGFQPSSTYVLSSAYLIEKTGANKKVLPSSITNVQAANYVDIYQNNVVNNTLPPDYELTVSMKNDILGQAVFSIYDKVNKVVLTSIIIKNFKTSNVEKPVRDPIAILEDNKALDNSDSGTVAAKPYDNSWLPSANNPTDMTPQALLSEVYKKQLIIRPISIPYDNGYLVVATGVSGVRGTFNNIILLVSREGKVISSVYFWQDNVKVSIIDVTYDSINNQVIAWFVKGREVWVSLSPLNPTTGAFTVGNSYIIEAYDEGIERQLSSDLAVVPIQNIDKTEYWLVNRALKYNDQIQTSSTTLNNNGARAKWLTRARFNTSNSTPSVKKWGADFSSKIVGALLNQQIFVNPNPDPTTKTFTAASKFKIHNISSNFINGNEYLGIDMSISFGGLVFEGGNNIHHILLKVSPDLVNPLNNSPIMDTTTWTLEYVFSSTVAGFTSSRFSDVSLISTPGSSMLTFNSPTSSNQINDVNRKGWFSHGSFYSQDRSYNALTMIIQSSLIKNPNNVIISGITESSSALDFSIPSGYYNNVDNNNNSFLVLQQPHWQKGKLALNIRNSGFDFGNVNGPSAGTGNILSNGREFKEISFNDSSWSPTITSNSGGAKFTGKTIGTINTINKGPYNAINISKNENGEDITSILYTSNETKLQIDPAVSNLVSGHGQTQLRLNTLKANTPIWNTKTIANTPPLLDAQNNISFIDVKTLSNQFKLFMRNQNVFSDIVIDLNDIYSLPLSIKGAPVWGTGNELTVKLWFPKYYENGILKTFNENTSPTVDVRIKNVNVPILNILKTNLAKIIFSGNTKNIVITGEDQALVSASNDQAQNQLVKDNVEILYNLNSLDANWYTGVEFVNALSKSKTNFFKSDIDSIKIKYSVKANSDYIVNDNTDQLVSPSQITNLLPFMHMDIYYQELAKVGASPDGIGVTGTNSSNITAITWPFTIDSEFEKIIAAGIKFQWTNDPNHADGKWVDYNFGAGAINKIDIGLTNPYLAVRIFADNNVTFDQTNYGKPITVTPKNIKILINLSETDLQNIVFGGNTKDLTINTNAITNLPSLNAIVDLQFSVGWDFANNVETNLSNEKWYSAADLIAGLKALPQSLFIKRVGYPAEWKDTFKLKSRFIIKPGINNSNNYIFANDKTEVNYTYAENQKLTIKNYINISNLQAKLETGKITFGVNDRPDSVTELNLASVTPEEKRLLAILGIQLDFAFGPTDPPTYTENWNDPFANPVNLGQPPTIWLKFVVVPGSIAITDISNPTWTHKAVEPQIEKPKFIQLDEANLVKTTLSGSTINLLIDETLSLVPGNNSNTQNEILAHIEIIYNINNLRLDVNDVSKVWFTKTELDAILPTYQNSIFLSDLANVRTNYRLKQASANNGWRIPTITPQLLNANNVYSFVHTLSYFNSLKDNRVSIQGTATNILNIIFPADFDKTTFKILESNGIVLQWTINKAATTDADWNNLILDDLTTYPKSIGVNPYLAMRIVTNQNRVITSAEVNKITIDVTPLSITIVYTVDSQVLANNLIPNGNTKKIDNLDEISSLAGAYPDYEHLEIRYKIGTTKSIEFIPGTEWYSFTDLKNQLLNYQKLILPSEKQITAKYFLKDGTPLPNPNPPITPQPYVGYVIEYRGNVQEANLNVTNFKSFVDVTNALANLNKLETTFAPGDTTEKITEILKIGLTNEESNLLFGSNLNLRGDLATELVSPNFANWWQPGKNNNLPKSLPNKDAAGKPVLMWRFALTTITDITFNADDNMANVSAITQLNVNLPVQIVINPADYDTIKAAIGGNTKILLLDDAINTAAIEAVKTRENLSQDIPLQILYAIGGGTNPEGLPIDETDPTKTWFTLTEFKTLLAAKTVDFNTNQIRAKFYIDPSYSNAGQKYILSTEIPENIQALDLTANAKVKIFINKANYETLPSQIVVSGSSNDLAITIPNELKPSPSGTISPGLELVWSIKDNPQLSDIAQTNNDIWTSVVPTMLDPTLKKLSVAYRIKPAYTLETPANKIYAIDTSKIFVYINVENVWLDQIVFAGNLFEATINETTFNNNITPLPGGEWVRIQYTIDDREWLLKDAFIAKLKQLEGSLDANNFILLKNKVKARYSIDPTKFAEYRLKVDGIGILDKPFVENPTLFRPILLSAVNNGFNGYINLSKVPDFDTSGFRITGTNAIPVLEFTSTGDKLQAQFAPYQDQTISPFDIYYTVDKGTGNGNFVLDDNHKLFGATGFKTTGFDPISISVADQFFGIKIVARAGYQIFKNNILQNNGFSFSVPLNIRTIKDNPFGTDKLVVKFEGYQGSGKVNLWYDGKNPSELASTILDRDNDLINQYYIEFHISNTQLTEDELNKLPQDSWIKVGAPDGQGGIIQLPSNLKVGQFVAGRIRMKESSKFEIKDIKLNDSISTKVINLLVDQSKIVINNAQLRNNEYSNQTNLIDGDIYINKINVERDSKDNYLGVDLILQVKTEFYKRPDGSFIINNNGLPIVKRVPTAFYDVFGPVTGSPSTEIRIYYTDSTKTIPTNPIETGTPIELDLTEVPDSLATFTYNLFSGAVNVKQGLLFQNQTFSIKIKAKNDFILDTSTPKPFEQKITNAKYPLNIDQNLVMSVQIPDPIKYETTGELTPQNGKAFITSDTDIQIQFVEDNGNISNTLKGAAAYDRLVKESNGKLRIRVTLKRKSSEENFFYNGTNLNLSQLQDLSNGDRILISLVPVDPNFVLIGPSSSIANWIVNALEIAAPNTDIFKDLKIVTNINGNDSIWDGQGTFFVAVKTGSGNPPEDLSDELLNPNNAAPGQTKFHFVYRVWGVDKKVRINWTPDKTRISSLKNGEKIEWRLKSQSDEPLSIDYFNTVAHNSVDKRFAVINVDAAGSVTYDSQFGIEGNENKYVEGTEIYPENQGFTVSGLVEGEIVLEGNLLQNIESIKLSFTGTNGAGSFSVNNPLIAEELLAQGIVISWYRNGQLISPDQSIAMLSNGDVISYKLSTTSSTVVIKNNITNSFIVSGLTESSNFAVTIATAVGISMGILTVLIVAAPLIYRKLIKNKLEGQKIELDKN
ncbi:MAG: hypothetical protein ACRCRP_01560 [Metamycoplasmataceae bacterium]